MVAAKLSLSGAREQARGFERVAARIARSQGPILEAYMSGVVADIKNSTASLFDKSSGVLASELWADNPVVRKSGASIEAGWGGASAAYGYVLERGPFTSLAWIIRPRGTVVSGKRAGKPILALRMVTPGGVVYRKAAVRWWNNSQLRPHWWPALERAEGPMLAEFVQTIQDAFEAEGIAV